jgi:hypothetical protein
MESIIKTRCLRGNLDISKSYIKVQKKGGVVIEEEVGQFVKSYRMGSGDGMTLHWEFVLRGKTIRVDDEMWGSVGGEELVGFRPKIDSTTVA